MADRMKNRNFIPEDFTLSLALVDALPVLFFSCSMVLIAGRFASILFCLGAAVIVLASCGKVLWKLLRRVHFCWGSCFCNMFSHTQAKLSCLTQFSTFISACFAAKKPLT